MLANYTVAQIYAFMLVFARMGTAFTQMPGIGDSYVPTRVRLLLAVAITFIITPVVLTKLPAMPDDPLQLGTLLISEVVIGLMFGTLLKMLMGALDTAGTLISFQIGLSSANVFNPAMAAQSSLISALLTTTGMVLIFTTDLGYMMIRGLVDTYAVFPPGANLPIGDFADVMARLVSRSFSIGLEIAAPFIVIGMLFFLALGLISRLMPQMQIFFIAQPIQIVIGMLLLSLTLTSGILFWMQGMDAALSGDFAMPH